MQVAVPVPLPARPVLQACPEDPGVQGTVTNRGTVEVKVDDAIRLKRYISELEFCNKANVIILNGHIEKLENRLRAIQ